LFDRKAIDAPKDGGGEGGRARYEFLILTRTSQADTTQLTRVCSEYCDYS